MLRNALSDRRPGCVTLTISRGTSNWAAPDIDQIVTGGRITILATHSQIGLSVWQTADLLRDSRVECRRVHIIDLKNLVPVLEVTRSWCFAVGPFSVQIRSADGVTVVESITLATISSQTLVIMELH